MSVCVCVQGDFPNVQLQCYLWCYCARIFQQDVQGCLMSMQMFEEWRTTKSVFKTPYLLCL